MALQLVGRMLRGHSWLIAVVLLVAFGEVRGRWSALLTAPQLSLADPAISAQLRADRGSDGQPVTLLSSGEEVRRFSLHAAVVEPLEPARSAPLQLQGAFRETHLLAAGETLGMVAERYGLSLSVLIWSNNLEQGDALMLGMPLRIPRVAGVPYRVADGEDLTAVAARLGVAPEAIQSFGPNRLQDGRVLLPGEEIFVPGAEPPLPDVLLLRGGLEVLAARGPEPAGLVLDDETNLRAGPSTDYPRTAQLARGRRVVVQARHADWLKVSLADLEGWVRADLLQLTDGLIDSLPQTDDFPPPPPRWVWPTWGSLSSTFGARWGGFHNGIDIANRAWTPIVAARTGYVTEAGWCSGYGYCVRISHGGGVETIYGHLITRPNVAVGDEVSAGQRIGSMGSTYDRAGGGYSTGVHLHFTVLVNGRAVNPLTVLP